MLKHLILDFDGVMADTFDINWPIVKEGDDSNTMEDFLAHHDGNVYATPRIKFEQEHFWEEYRKRLTPGHLEKALEPLQRLGQRYALYIVSSTSENIIKEILKLAGLSPLFVSVLGQETHRSKVEKFKILMTQYGLTSENSLFVTDTLGDIREANELELKTIAVTFGFHPRERLALGEPFKIVDSWQEIEETINTL